jgi:lysozyme
MRAPQFLPEGLKLLKEFEGCALSSYQDAGGRWTIGYGHTSGVGPGMTCTADQAETWLRDDIGNTCEAVLSTLPARSILKITDAQFTAVVCFGFNVKGWATSPQLQRIRDCDWESAEAHWVEYDHDTENGQKIEVAGLRRRREAELALFRTPNPRDELI